MQFKELEYVIMDEDMGYVAILELESEEFYNYWMDVADPRGKYLQELELHIMTGGGYY